MMSNLQDFLFYILLNLRSNFCISTELVRHTKTKPCNTTWAELIAILTVCDLSSVFIVSLSTIHDLFGHEALSTLKVSSEIRPCLMFVTSESHHDQCPNYWRKKRGQFGKYQTINLIIICKWIVFFMWKIICDIIILVYMSILLENINFDEDHVRVQRLQTRL